MVALVDTAVHHEVVQLRIGLHRLVVRGDDHGHVADADAAAPLFADIRLDDLLIDVLGDGVLCVVPLGHDVGDGRHDRRQVLYSRSVRTHGQTLDSV